MIGINQRVYVKYTPNLPLGMVCQIVTTIDGPLPYGWHEFTLPNGSTNTYKVDRPVWIIQYDDGSKAAIVEYLLVPLDNPPVDDIEDEIEPGTNRYGETYHDFE